MSENMKGLTEKEKEIIKTNLAAFNANFEALTIEKVNKVFYVFQDVPNWLNHNWLYYTDNINNLNGWLNGAVKAIYTLKKR